jgi:hypothetical protein
VLALRSRGALIARQMTGAYAEEARKRLWKYFSQGPARMPTSFSFFGPAAVNGDFSSTLFGRVVRAAPPRLMQVAAKFTF